MSKVKLGEVAIEHKETCKGNKADYPVVGLEHLVPEEINLTAWNEGGDNTFTKIFRKGNVLFGRRRAYLKKAAVAPFDGICSGDITIIEAIPNRILSELLPFVIQNDALFDFAVGKSAGSLSPRVKWEHLKTYEFELPTLAKQKELAEVLWAMDATKQAYQKLLAATDELVKAHFVEMFEKDSVDKTELKNVAQSWLKGQPLKKEQLVKNGRSKCIHYGELFTTYNEVISHVNSKTNVTPVKVSKIGDILFPASDVTPLGLTRCSAIMLDDVILGGDIIVMRPTTELNSEYLSYAIRMQKRQLLSRVTGVLVRHISAKSLQTVKIPFPSKEMQEQFAVFVRQSDKAKSELERTLSELTATYKRIIAENLG